MCSKDYSGQHSSITETMRKILVDWLVDVHRKFKLRQTTMFMAVNLIDRYLERTQESLQKNRFQLFGITCLFIAAKYEEIYPPGLSDFVYVCADTYSASEILEMESKVLTVLDFDLVYSSALQLHGLYARESTPRLSRVPPRQRTPPRALLPLPHAPQPEARLPSLRPSQTRRRCLSRRKDLRQRAGQCGPPGP